MIDISKAHFLLLLQHFLHGYLFRLTERETLCCKVNKGSKPNSRQSSGIFSCRGYFNWMSRWLMIILLQSSHRTPKPPANIFPADSPSALQLLAFLQGLFTFYHEGYELASEFEPYKQQLQFNLQNVSVYIYCKVLDQTWTWYHFYTVFMSSLLYLVYLPIKPLRESIWKSVSAACRITYPCQSGNLACWNTQWKLPSATVLTWPGVAQTHILLPRQFTLRHVYLERVHTEKLMRGIINSDFKKTQCTVSPVSFPLISVKIISSWGKNVTKFGVSNIFLFG